MSAQSLDIEFSKCWSQLTALQKQSLLSVIKSFVQQAEKTNIEQYNQEIEESETEYKKGDYISQEEMLKLIQQW